MSTSPREPDRPPSTSLKIPVISELLDRWRWFRRGMSRSEWGRRLLRARIAEHDGEGLVLIQIDGLSRTQLERAIAGGRMPFLRHVIEAQAYQLHTHYSGLPSTTAAVQAELFYGVRAAVPAHAYGDAHRTKVVTMLDSDLAKSVEEKICHKGTPLLRCGSAYCNIYTGGAEESHFCASAMGWKDLLRAVSWWRWSVLLLMHFGSLLRIVGQAIAEVGLAISDCFRGATSAKEFWEELKFIPSRVVVAVVMRELMTISAAIDLAVGLPVIELNFLGYDEHAHRRGPSSRFAHWTLKAIDRSIRKLWREATRAQRRHYQVWIYSDHGQEDVTPYDELTGRLITDVVKEAFARQFPVERNSIPSRRSRGMTEQRARFLKRSRTVTEEHSEAEAPSEQRQAEVLVVAIGPLGHVYLPAPVTAEETAEACRQLAGAGRVPLVLARDGDCIKAWTDAGAFDLWEHAELLFGKQHPFLVDLTQDLVEVFQHPDAGDIVIAGWRDGVKPLTFVYERGAHGGVGPEETAGFALLPAGTSLAERKSRYLRPIDLRHAAEYRLDIAQSDRKIRRFRSARSTLRVVSYNVHSCMGLDGHLSIRRIAAVLAQCDADVIALQELDARRPRSGMNEQAAELAQLLEMDVQFHPALQFASEAYGDAVLSRLPLQLVKAGALPTEATATRWIEPRGAVWVEIDFHGRRLQLLNTHLGLRQSERRRQVEALLGPDWLGSVNGHGPVIVCGDLNCGPKSPEYRILANRYRDAQAVTGHRPRNTWISLFPVLRIDHLFVSEDLDVRSVIVPRTDMIRLASDHLPLVVDLAVPDIPRV